MSETNPFELPSEWDHLPGPKELSNWMTFLPGIDYCWALVRNLPKSKKHGWSLIQLSGPDGLVGQVSPMQVAGQDVILLCQGKPIIGCPPGTTGVVFKIDPELAELLKVNGAVKEAEGSENRLSKLPQPKQAAAR